MPDRSEVPWPSTGWTNNRNVPRMLEILVARGEIAIAGRTGRQPLWDLAERVYPADTPIVPAAEATRIRDGRRVLPTSDGFAGGQPRASSSSSASYPSTTPLSMPLARIASRVCIVSTTDSVVTRVRPAPRSLKVVVSRLTASGSPT